MKNVAFGFVLMFIWVNLIYHKFLPYMADHRDLREFIYGVIFAAIWESIVFIWAPYKILTAINKDIVFPGMVMACAVFGLMHGHGTTSLLMQGLMGGVFVWVYIRNGYSLTSAIILHAAWNFYCWISN